MIKGIDVSNYQSATFGTNGFDFVIIKATQGTGYINPKMTAQASWARSRGLLVGFYHFLQSGNIQAQAEYFVTKADSVGTDLLACDWETDPATKKTPSNAEKDAFLKAVKKLRPTHQVILYTGQDAWLTKDTTSFVQDGLWIAQYNGRPGQPSIRSKWLIHQYTSTPLDTNVAQFDSKAEMAAWMAGSSEDDMPTADEVAAAVLKKDGIIKIPGAPASNPTWALASSITEILTRIDKANATLTGQSAAIAKLASLIGKDVDTAEVIKAVTAAVNDAVEKAVIKVDVEVGQHE